MIRLLMVLRGLGITDAAVLGALERVPRHLFVPEAFLDKAYEDVALPIGGGQTISQPSVVARMTGALDPGPRMTVLEVGTGSGYQAAVLSHLCRRLYTVERDPGLLAAAEARFRDLRRTNIVSRVGDGALGWPEQPGFDRIIVTAGAGDMPPALTRQLRPGGVMIIPLGPLAGGQRIVRVVNGKNGLETEDLWPVRFVGMSSDIL